MKQYDGRTGVIIGGTSGVSYATARYLLDRGARVLVTGRTKASIDAVREDLGLDVIAIESDATSMADIDPLPTG
jgi:NAD(P)-dependent dehydrogenase (short-subunit alcohol dehydrogenase family)